MLKGIIGIIVGLIFFLFILPVIMSFAFPIIIMAIVVGFVVWVIGMIKE